MVYDHMHPVVRYLVVLKNGKEVTGKVQSVDTDTKKMWCLPSPSEGGGSEPFEDTYDELQYYPYTPAYLSCLLPPGMKQHTPRD